MSDQKHNFQVVKHCFNQLKALDEAAIQQQLLQFEQQQTLTVDQLKLLNEMLHADKKADSAKDVSALSVALVDQAVTQSDDDTEALFGHFSL